MGWWVTIIWEIQSENYKHWNSDWSWLKQISKLYTGTMTNNLGKYIACLMKYFSWSLSLLRAENKRGILFSACTYIHAHVMHQTMHFHCVWVVVIRLFIWLAQFIWVVLPLNCFCENSRPSCIPRWWTLGCEKLYLVIVLIYAWYHSNWAWPGLRGQSPSAMLKFKSCHSSPSP